MLMGAEKPDGDGAISAMTRAGLYEVRAADFRAIPAAWGFLLAMASGAKGALVWVEGPERLAPFGVVYAPGLQALGIDPSRLVIVRAAKSRDALWAMEEALRAGVGAVIGERPKGLHLTASRRLHLAAEKAESRVFQLRASEDGLPSPAIARWRVAPMPPSRDRFGFVAAPRWHAVLERVRGGAVGEWVVELDHEAHRLRLSSLLGDRAARHAA